MNAPGLVIVLNGTGSSGKTTLARALQAAAPHPLIHMGIDAFVSGLPRQYVGTASNSGEGLRFRVAADGSTQAMEAGPVLHRLVRGMHRAVAALAASGNSVVVDHSLWQQEWLEDCALILPKALFVGVHCSREVVQQRTRSRGDRPTGYELFAFDIVHAGREYDVEVDTTDSNTARCLASILHRLSAGPPLALAARRDRGDAGSRDATSVAIGSVSWSWRAPAWSGA